MRLSELHIAADVSVVCRRFELKVVHVHNGACFELAKRSQPDFESRSTCIHGHPLLRNVYCVHAWFKVCLLQAGANSRDPLSPAVASAYNVGCGSMRHHA